MITKNELRKTLGLIRQNIESRVQKERLILDKLIDFIDKNNFESIFTYVSFGSEADTHRLINRYFNKKIIAAPFTQNGVMSSRQMLSFNDLNADKNGNLKNAALGNVITAQIAIVPGLGFNKNCYRIGYGGGYYDKYLKDYCGVKAGIAFDEQLCDNLVIEPFDMQLDYIFTPTKIFCRENNKKQ